MRVSPTSEIFCAFNKLTAYELARLELTKRPFCIGRGEELNRQHMEADGLYCIESGFAKIVWPEKSAKETIIKIVAPGDMTGYRCLFSEKKFRATAVSLSNSLSGFFLPKEHFFELLQSNAEFNFEILRRMGEEIRLSENRLHSFVQKSVRERMAEALIHLHGICGKRIPHEDTIVLDIQLTREEISSWIGTAKETVVRCLSDMRDEGIIDQIGNAIAIKDLAAIKKIASA